MKNRGTYALLALFFVSLIGLGVADRVGILSREQRARMSSRILHELLDTKPDDLRKIEILGGPETLVFERVGTQWQMKSPIDVAADPSKVESLAYNLKELTRRPEAAALEGDPARFGLAPPERVIRLWGDSSGEPLASLDVGAVSLDRRYVRPSGLNVVEVVDARALDLLKLPTVRWRDHELFRVPSFEVGDVKISSPERSVKFTRGRDSWRITEPVKLLAEDSRVDGLIADLGSLKVLDDTRFIANDVRGDALEAYGLKKPSLTIEVDSRRLNPKRDVQTLLVGKAVPGKEGQVYVMRGGQDDVLAVDTRVLKDLKPEPDAYRSPKVADFNLARVTRIAIEQPAGGEAGFEAVRLGPDWTIVEPSPMRGDRKAIQDFLKSLDELKTSIYLKPEAVSNSGVDKPALILKVWQLRDLRPGGGASSDKPGEDLAMTLRIGRRDAARKSIYAQLEGDTKTILALPDTANEFLPRSVLAFRDRQVLAVQTDQIERIKYSGGSRKFSFNAPALKIDPFGSGPLGWWMVEPIDAPADVTSMGMLLRVLANLKAETLVTETPDNLNQFGLNPPALTLTWSSLPTFSMIPEPPKPRMSPGTITLEDHSLLVGGPVPGRPTLRYAKLSDKPLIFTLGPEALGILDTELRDRTVLAFDPKHVRKVRLDWPETGLTVDASEVSGKRKWLVEGPVDVLGFDPAQVEALVQGLSKLSTYRYAQHLGDFPQASLLSSPQLAIRFELDDGSLPRTLKLGASTGRGQLFATTETEPRGTVFVLPETPFRTWIKPPRHQGDLPDNVFEP